MKLIGRRTPEIAPHEGPVPVEGEIEGIIGGRSGTLRAGIFGANDGLVSNLSLIMGVAGARLDPEIIVLAGVAGLLAGAFSMGAGEYISMRVQREIFERLIHLEAHELAMDPEGETLELARILERRGIPRGLASQTAEALMADPKVALEVHAKEELGLDPEELGSPWGAAISSFTAFSLGALIPLLPFLIGEGMAATVAAVGLSLTALFSLGAVMTRFTGRTWPTAGLRMLAIGGGAALVTYWVGRLVGVSVG